jgi:hypothetical protein
MTADKAINSYSHQQIFTWERGFVQLQLQAASLSLIQLIQFHSKFATIRDQGMRLQRKTDAERAKSRLASVSMHLLECSECARYIIQRERRVSSAPRRKWPADVDTLIPWPSFPNAGAAFKRRLCIMSERDSSVPDDSITRAHFQTPQLSPRDCIYMHLALAIRVQLCNCRRG